ncbi:MAG: hypothetical protein M1409_07230 [Actinobacteria bacterium]|nr:hypothetical protein [Actinomycetota bacterium]
MKEEKNKEYMESQAHENPQRLEDNSIYNEIFKEMLYLENPKSIKYKIKYCLVKLSIKNIEEIMFTISFTRKKEMVIKFSDILFYKLRKTRLFTLNKFGEYVILFFDISIENLNMAFKEVEKQVDKEFEGKIKLQWNILKTTEKEDEIKPLLRESQFMNRTIERDLSKKYPGISVNSNGANDVVVKGIGVKSMFKCFIISYLIFFFIITFIGLIIDIAELNSNFLPASFRFSQFLSVLNLGFLNNFNSHFITIIFFILIGLVFSVIFGFIGMLVGWLINLSLRISGGIDLKLRN